jgi:hypothetical protein
MPRRGRTGERSCRRALGVARGLRGTSPVSSSNPCVLAYCACVVLFSNQHRVQERRLPACFSRKNNRERGTPLRALMPWWPMVSEADQWKCAATCADRPPKQSWCRPVYNNGIRSFVCFHNSFKLQGEKDASLSKYSAGADLRLAGHDVAGVHPSEMWSAWWAYGRVGWLVGP